MSKVLEFVQKNWKEIWGFGRYTKTEDGMYVVIPTDLLLEEYGITFDELRGLENE